MNLSIYVYRVTSKFPTTERFGLVDQMRRASVSISSNISEGFGRGSDKELIRFLYMAKGSSNELDTQTELSKALTFLSKEEADTIINLNNRINKMITSLIYRRKNGLDSFDKTDIPF